MTDVRTAPAGARIRVPLRDLGLAPENLRAAEPADEDIPRLADTIRAAGLIYPPIVRKGRKGEAPFMVLDGRRRRLALLRLVEAGAMAPGDEIECLLAADRAAQAAATVVTNAERAPVHTADVIVAIGRLRKSRMETGAIAAALGYDEVEVRRLEALAQVHPGVLDAFRRGRLTLRQVRMFARLPDRKRQGEFAEAALGGWFSEWQLQALVNGGRVTTQDPRFLLVGTARYLEAGGRLDSDLFGETPDVAHDPDRLDALWRARAEALSDGLAAEGLEVRFADEDGFVMPDGLRRIGHVWQDQLSEAQQAAFEAARRAASVAFQALQGLDLATDAAETPVRAWLAARLGLARVSVTGGTVEAVLLTPGPAGLESTFFWRPAEAADAGDTDEDDGGAEVGAGAGGFTADIPSVEVEADVEGRNHRLHETCTDLATRGLIRDLADNPAAALTALVAQLFKQLALRDPVTAGTSALTVSAKAYSRPGAAALEALDGAVRARLAARREAYLASGLRPIGFVAALPHGEKMALLAELTALALDLREPRTSSVRREARAEASEIAALCGADLVQHWTPDAAFLETHARAQLLTMLAAMGVDDDRAGRLRKAELVAFVAEAAAERRWAPASVLWPGLRGPDAVDPGESAGERGVEASEADPPTAGVVAAAA
jgi:ParB family chromosome partitioning protein